MKKLTALLLALVMTFALAACGTETVTVTGTPEPAVEPTAEPTAEPFTGTVEIKLVNTGDIYFGDTVTLRAIVRGANTDYEIRWEANDGAGWVEVRDDDRKDDELTFVVDEDNAKYDYRVVLITEA